jgi:hypothetical protein
LFAILVTRRIAVPLERLTAAVCAWRVVTGSEVTIERQDELGDLQPPSTPWPSSWVINRQPEERASARTAELARSNQKCASRYIVSDPAPLVNLALPPNCALTASSLCL